MHRDVCDCHMAIRRLDTGRLLRIRFPWGHERPEDYLYWIWVTQSLESFQKKVCHNYKTIRSLALEWPVQRWFLWGHGWPENGLDWTVAIKVSKFLKSFRKKVIEEYTLKNIVLLVITCIFNFLTITPTMWMRRFHKNKPGSRFSLLTGHIEAKLLRVLYCKGSI